MTKSVDRLSGVQTQVAVFVAGLVSLLAYPWSLGVAPSGEPLAAAERATRGESARASVRGAAVNDLPVGARPAAVDPAKDQALDEAIQFVDAQVAAGWAEAGITPASPADNAELVRRLSLDLCGVIPTREQIDEFEKCGDVAARRALIARWQQSPEAIQHATFLWLQTLLPEVVNNPNPLQSDAAFRLWLRERLAANVPYNTWVRELLTVPLTARRSRGGQMAGDVVASPALYFEAKQAAPETLTAATTRAFLGIRLECAECHDHPFDHWKRDQFWSLAAFFAGIERRAVADENYSVVVELYDRREILIPQTDRVVQARFLDDQLPDWEPRTSGRESLSRWVTSTQNRAFAEAVVNRYWAQCFGRGLVDPVDDFTVQNACSHPQLLAGLADRLIAADFDLRFLQRVMLGSRVYQLSSRQTDASQADLRRLGRMPLKGLSSHQVRRSLERLSLIEPTTPMGPPGFDFLAGDELGQLAALAADQETPADRRISVLQSLAVMNGPVLQRLLDSQVLTLPRVIAESDWMDREEQLDAVFLAVLARRPSEQERADLTAELQTADQGAARWSAEGLADVGWSLLNSVEFWCNH